jgi:hypothetical protein
MIGREKNSQPRKERSARRCTLVASAEVTELGSETRLLGRISELGAGGCYVDALNAFPEGTLVKVRILRDQGHFESTARVAYCDPSFGMGLAFTDVPPEQRSILEEWIAQIVTEPKSVA